MEKLSMLFDDVALLWEKYASSYLTGMGRTLLLAVIATLAGCVIGFACGVPLIKWFLQLRNQPPKAENDTKTQSGKDEQYGKQGKDQPQRNDGDLHEQGAGDGQQ